jgi:hypothetical protein
MWPLCSCVYASAPLHMSLTHSPTPTPFTHAPLIPLTPPSTHTYILHPYPQ